MHGYPIHVFGRECCFVTVSNAQKSSTLPVKQMQTAFEKTLQKPVKLRLLAEAASLSALAANVSTNSLVKSIRTGISQVEMRNCTTALDAASHGNDAQRQIYARALSYIDAHFMQDIGREDVARAIFVSQSYLSQIFHDIGNTSFVAYLTEQRMKHAVALLEQDIRVSDIVTMTGYHNKQNFLRNFHSYTGMTPSEYRRRILEIRGEDNDS